MFSNSIGAGGAVCFWSLSRWHNRDTLKDGLELDGLDKFIPAVRSKQQALRDALGEVYPKHSVEYTLGKRFYQVDRIVRTEADVEFQKVFLASIDENSVIHLDPPNYSACNRVVEAFNKHLGLVAGESVSQCLIRYCDHLGGTRLRPVGGIYWLPDFKLDEFEKMTRLVEASAVGQSACYFIRHALDMDAARAVKDAIVADIRKEASDLRTEIEGGTLSEKQIGNRKETGHHLRQKVKMYEEILGQGLASLHESLDSVEQATAQASILESIAGSLEEAG